MTGVQTCALPISSTRIPLINGMSEINAKNFQLPYTQGKGLEFDEEYA